MQANGTDLNVNAAATTTNVNGKPQIVTDIHGNTSLAMQAAYGAQNAVTMTAVSPVPNGTVRINGSLYKEADPGVHMAIPASASTFSSGGPASLASNPDLIPQHHSQGPTAQLRSPMPHLRSGNGLGGHLASPIHGSTMPRSPHHQLQSPYQRTSSPSQQAVNPNNATTSPVPHHGVSATLDRHIAR